ncbi:MAG: carbohydrate kinase family protein [Acuticoccus sp.]
MARRGIVTAGTWCADHNKVVPYWPGEDRVTEVLSHEVRSGGSAANLAIDIKRLDPSVPVATIGLLGEDADGAILFGEAEAAGLDTSRLIRLKGARTHATDAFLSKESGRRTHLSHFAVGRDLSPDHIDFSGLDARFAHIGLPGVHDTLDGPWGEDASGWVTVLRKAKAAGLVTNLELCSIPAERINAIVRPCLPHLDLVIVNDFEIAAIDGAAPEATQGPDALIACAQRVLGAGAMGLVVVHFPEGAVAVARDGTIWREPSLAVPAAEVVGPNGVGDAFAAGVIYGLHEDWEVARCLRLGHAAAAMSLRSVGTTDSVESWQACLAQAERWGTRPPI